MEFSVQARMHTRHSSETSWFKFLFSLLYTQRFSYYLSISEALSSYVNITRFGNEHLRYIFIRTRGHANSYARRKRHREKDRQTDVKELYHIVCLRNSPNWPGGTVFFLILKFFNRNRMEMSQRRDLNVNSTWILYTFSYHKSYTKSKIIAWPTFFRYKMLRWTSIGSGN